jgi:6-phosphogluconolactonase
MNKLLLALAACASLHAENFTVFVGTYTATNGSKGIYKFDFDDKTGAATQPELAGEMGNPSFVAIDPKGKFLYAVGETGMFEGKKQGSVSAFSIAPDTRKLTLLNTQPSGGADPCHINVDRDGKNVLLANYTGGSVEVIPVDTDGKLKAPSSFIQHVGKGATPRQTEPHAHSINLDKPGKLAFVCDLGLDKVFTYKYDSKKGTLTEFTSVSLAPGSGPRHFAFSPDFKRAYAINELASTLTAFTYDGNGKLTETQTLSTLPEPTPGNSTAEVVVHPSGKFVYGSNRGHNSIAVFAVDSKGHLERIQNEPVEGKTPRNFVVDPSGKWLIAAMQDSNNITIHKIDPATGKLSYTGASLQAFKPVCLRFLKN